MENTYSRIRIFLEFDILISRKFRDMTSRRESRKSCRAAPVSLRVLQAETRLTVYRLLLVISGQWAI